MVTVSGAPRLVVVGGGRMGEALTAGLIGAGWADAGEIVVVEAEAERRATLGERFAGLAVRATIPPCADLVVVVKPGDVASVCREAAAVGVLRVLSLAAGVTLQALEADLPGAAVIRAMPNTGALVGAGVAAIAPGTGASETDMAWAETVLGAVGRVVRLPEQSLDAVTGLSGSGPAYVFLLAEALVDAGVLVGLSREVATTLTLQTLLGAARLLTETGSSPEALRAAVTSPAGTTAAGLRVLEAAGVRSAVLEAVVAATERSRALGVAAGLERRGGEAVQSGGEGPES